MIQEGQIVLFRFPQTDQTAGKLRPALVVRKLLGPHDDWMICMISSQLSQCIAGFDETITPDALDFQTSGLKTASLIRILRLAVVDKAVLCGAIGHISSKRLVRIQTRLSSWIRGA